VEKTTVTIKGKLYWDGIFLGICKLDLIVRMTLIEVSKLHCTQIFTFKDFSALDKLLQTAA